MLDSTEIRDNFQYYYDFYISAKEKSFADAGRKYYIDRTILNRSVIKLEELLDLKLIKTSNKGHELTLDGERLLKELDRFFMIVKSFDFKNISSNIDITLTIGTTRNIADFFLEEYLNKFQDMYPEVTIDVKTDSAKNLNEYLINHQIDVLIDYLPYYDSTEKSPFEIEPIKNIKTCFACGETYYKTIKSQITSLKDLENYKLVIPGKSRRRQVLDQTLQEHNVKLNPIVQMPDSKLMADLIKKRNYIGYFIEAALSTYGLTKVELKEEMPNNLIGIIYPNNTMNYVTRNFVEMVTNKDMQ